MAKEEASKINALQDHMNGTEHRQPNGYSNYFHHVRWRPLLFLSVYVAKSRRE
jgi:hypothetical protein